MTKSNLHLLGCNTNLAMSSSENKPQKQTYWFYKWPLWLRILLLITLPGIFIPIAVWPKIKIPNWVKGVLLIPWSFVVLIAYIIMLAIIVSPFSSTSTKNPIFSVSGISEGEIKKDDKISFKIKTDPLTVDEVTINGESATKKGWDSEYSLDKTFPEGDNNVKIIAKKDGKITEKEFNFKVDLSERKAEAEKQRLEAERVTNEKNNRTTEQKVSDLSTEIFPNEKGYSSVFSNKTAILNFNVSEGSFWDEKHILEQMLADMVKFGGAAFNNPEIAIVEVNYRSKLVDRYGKETDGNLMFVSIEKREFLKYNFDNIKGRNFYNSVEKNAFIVILPSTKEKIDFSKVNVTDY